MRRRSVGRSHLALLACFALGVMLTGASLAARQTGKADVSALTQRFDEIEQEKGRVQAALRRVKRDQQSVTRKLSDIDTKLTRAERRLMQVSRDLGRARTDLERAAEECRGAEGALSRHHDLVADRLVAMYKQGRTGPASLLLQSASFGELANRMYLLDQVVKRDAKVLEEFEGAHQQAQKRRAEVTERERQLADLREKLARQREVASAARQTTEHDKRRLLKDRAIWERALAELEQDSAEVAAMLQRLQRTSEGQDRLATPWQGKLNWPLQGRISSPYGYRVHPIYRVRKMHTGIDIAASSGTPIRAAASGTVVHAARWGGYGNCVILDHGGGLATLYGHCSRLAVNEGGRVTQGQVIAYVGSTGLSTGPHLHFEVRRDGQPVNPMPML